MSTEEPTFFTGTEPLREEAKVQKRLGKIRQVKPIRHPIVEGARKEALRRIRMADKGEGNPTVFSSAAWLGKYIPGGFLTEEDVRSWLEDAAEQADVSDYQRAINNGLEAGMNDPVMEIEDPEEEDEKSYLEVLREATYTVADLATLPEPRWLVDHVLAYDTLNFSIGPPGSGKSFGAVDLIGCVATGKDWFGRSTVQDTVLYGAFEGVSGLHQRFSAWQQHYDREIKRAVVLTEAVKIKREMNFAQFIQYAKREVKPGLIVLDTFAWMSTGYSETINEEMQEAGEQLDRLRKATGACVYVVHHTRKTNEKIELADLRGASSIAGMLTTVLGYQKVKGTKTINVSCLKQKDVEEFDDFETDLVAVQDPDHKVMLLRDPAAEYEIPAQARDRMITIWRQSFGRDFVTLNQLTAVGAVPDNATFWSWEKRLVNDGVIEAPVPKNNTKLYRLPLSEEDTEDAMIEYGEE